MVHLLQLIDFVNFKNSHNLEIESYVFFGGDFQDFKPRRQHLKWPWENCSEEVGEESGYAEAAVRDR